MLKFAIQNLISRPLRTALSVLGLAVAIAGMVALFSIAGGINKVVSETFRQIPGLLVQQRGAPIPLFSTLPANWEEELESIPGVGVVEPEVFSRVNQLDEQLVINPPRFAVGMDIDARRRLKNGIYRENMVDGRFLNTKEDFEQQNCVISKEIADSLKRGVGDRVAINGVDFQIVGIYETGSLMFDVNMLMDINVCRRLGRFDEETVSWFYVEPDESVPKKELQKHIEEQFRGRKIREQSQSAVSGNPLANLVRQLSSGRQAIESQTDQTATTSTAKEVSPIEVRSADDWGDRIAEFSKDLNLFLVLMTAIGVSIATLSIVNTMLMSVTERTTEFGILRANGWSRGEIVRLMTMESASIGFLGGLVGILVGWIATLVVNWTWPGRLQLHAGLGLLLASLCFSMLLGLVGGIYPAWRAASYSPMESIRRG